MINNPFDFVLRFDDAGDGTCMDCGRDEEDCFCELGELEKE